MHGSNSPSSTLSRRRRFLFALFVSASVLILLETAFRLSGLFPDPGPFTEFKGDDGRAMVRFNLTDRQAPFSRDPEAGTTRIVITGGSTAAGFPYEPNSSIAIRLQSLIEQSNPQAKVEIINLGRNSANSSEIADIVSAVRAYHPYCIIIYSGHNEFLTLHRRLPAWVEYAGKKLSHLKLAQAAGAVAALVIGKGAENIRRDLEKGPLALRRPPPITPEIYRGVIKRYRHNVRSFAQPPGGPPVILCAAASNLSGWPPTPHSYPASFTVAERLAADHSLNKARLLISREQFWPAAVLLLKEKELRPGYAAVSFELGRARLGLGEQAGDGPAGQALRQEALKDFRDALTENSLAVLSHRAPPHLNRILRKMAEKHGLLFFDTEEVLAKAAGGPPGFDLFTDHCHPNLEGQQILAEALFKFLQENLPGFPAKNDPGPWDEISFREKQNISADFLKHVELSLGVFLGLKMDFPNQSAAIREKFRLASQLNSDDPMPLLLGSLIAAHYSAPWMEARDLAGFTATNSQALEHAVRKYFTDQVELRDNLLMARIDLDSGSPPLAGLIKRGLFQDATSEDHGNQRPISDFNVFMDLEDDGADVSSEMNRGIKRREQRTSKADPVVYGGDGGSGRLAPGPGAEAIDGETSSTYAVHGPTYLTSGPIKIRASDYASAEIVFQTEGQSGDTVQVSMQFKWKDEQGRERTADVDFPISVPGDTVAVDLTQSPRWVMADEIEEIRILPNLPSGTFKLKSFKITP